MASQTYSPDRSKSRTSLFSAETLQIFLLFAIMLLQPFRALHGIYDSFLFVAMIFVIVMTIKKRLPPLPRPFIYILGFYTASILLSTLLSIDHKQSIRDIRSEYVKQLIVFGLVITMVAKPEGKTLAILAAFFLSGLIMCTGGFFPFLHWGSYSTLDHRLVSLAKSYTRLGHFYIFYVPFLVLLLRGKHPMMQKIGIYVILLLSLAATLCTKTRAAWVTVPLAAVIVFLIMRMWRHLIAFLLIIAVALCLLYFMSPSVQTRMKDFKQLTDWSGSFGQRIGIWKSATRTISEHPLFGVGYGKYIFKKAYHLNPVEGSRSYVDVHNTYLEILLERGVVGFLTTLVLYLYFLRRARLMAKGSAPVGRAYFAYFVAISFAFGIFSLTGNIYLKESGRYLWELAALGWCIPSIKAMELEKLIYTDIHKLL